MNVGADHAAKDASAQPQPPSAKPSADAPPLRLACIEQALAIIETEGLESLSLREVARRLNVSHQAPYKHFENRDHILAETIGKAFANFAAYLRARTRHDDPMEDLAALGAAYIAYALRHPAQYRLMFGTPMPDAARYPQVMELTDAPFAILREAIGRLPGRSDQAAIREDALFAWTSVHGLASVLQTRISERLGLHDAELTDVIAGQLRRIAAALTRGPS